MKKETESKLSKILEIGNLILPLILIIVLLYEVSKGAYSGSSGLFSFMFMMIVALVLIITNLYYWFRRKKKE